ncbi:heavy metal-binding domain-containing protein [Flavobacterium sp.]|uniref:heavy metal-binding domain-containing protein n=1 Tax=Flavobacterium sp. TaxID=239 RepID=UPI00286DE5F2|nr:heavy metal-binding domain-containing protein [Flavobacterium sp.]
MNTTENKYACIMHPEIQGKLNDKCSQCGMFLTVSVPEKPEKLDSNGKKLNHNRNN